MSNLSATLDTQVIDSITKAPKAPKAPKTIIKTVIVEKVISVKDMTIEQLKDLQKELTAQKQVLVPKVETPAYRVARREEAKDILNEIMGMNKSFNLIKKRFEADASYFNAFTDKPGLLKMDRIEFLLKTLKNLTMFLKKDIPSVSPRLVLDKIITLASMDSKYDNLKVTAQNLLKAK